MLFSQNKARVADGARLLDAYMPDWASRIDLSILDLENVERCILGQLYGDYLEGLYRLHLCFQQTVDNGFTTPVSSWLPEKGRFRSLTRCWKKEVLKRTHALTVA